MVDSQDPGFSLEQVSAKSLCKGSNSKYFSLCSAVQLGYYSTKAAIKLCKRNERVWLCSNDTLCVDIKDWISRHFHVTKYSSIVFSNRLKCKSIHCETICTQDVTETDPRDHSLPTPWSQKAGTSVAPTPGLSCLFTKTQLDLEPLSARYTCHCNPIIT